jgi:hypothetical protein
MSVERLKSRLTVLESKSTSGFAVLKFADGSTRSVRIDDPLELICEAMRLASFHLGQPEGCEDDAPIPKPAPPEKLAAIMELVGAAESVACENNLINLAHGLLHNTCGELEQSPPPSTQLNETGGIDGF